MISWTNQDSDRLDELLDKSNITAEEQIELNDLQLKFNSWRYGKCEGLECNVVQGTLKDYVLTVGGKTTHKCIRDIR